MAQTGRVFGARHVPVEALYASVRGPSITVNASSMVVEVLVHGRGRALRGLQRLGPRTGDSQPQSELKQREVPRLVVR